MTAAATPSWPESQAGFWSWQMEGACRAVSPSLFYSPEGERGARKALREGAAKAVCATCRVVEVCAAYAIACREPYGTWGGLSERDRETAYPRVDPVQAQAAYRRALAIWQERLVLPRPGSVSGHSFQPGERRRSIPSGWPSPSSAAAQGRDTPQQRVGLAVHA